MAMATVAGLASALILPIINTAAQMASHKEASFRLLVLFVIMVAIYSVGQRYFMSRSIAGVEQMLDRLRVRLADKIRHCDLQPLEQIGRTVIYSSITKETTTISQAALVLVVNMQFAVLTFFTAIYVLFLSPIAFFLTAGSTFLIVLAYRARLKKINVQLYESMKKENELFDALTNLLEGFKEVRLNRKRSDDLFHDLEEISHSVADVKSTSMAQISATFVVSQIFFYILLGLIVFVVPRLTSTYTDQVVQITTAVLFLIGPITSMVSSAQNVAAANVAAATIGGIEDILDKSISQSGERTELRRSFREIEFDNVVFHYADKSGGGFTVGPLNFEVRAGEVIFIAGGNGSGKSTFLKLVTGLYYPSQGAIRLDGEALTPATYDAYRSLFATVFTDYHLFRRLYGLHDIPQAKVEATLQLIELADKTAVRDSAFETLDLSAGQRKRLALMVSLLEDRPIAIFDEVAADQDPAFRRKFYKEVLPLLKKGGKTVIAVTHDDRYFDEGDRLLKMDEGRFVNDDAA
jgi:putative ATP-binding cassette transporter